MKCKRCGSEDIREYWHDTISVGDDRIGGVYAACRDCGLHADLDELYDEETEIEQDEWEL